jgi:hypothetical protein
MPDDVCQMPQVLRYACQVSPEVSANEDTRVWVGRVASGHEADNAAFLEWLNGPDAQAIFRRKRLTEYLLTEDNGTITVVLKARHTGDPRIMIDFLRYPGLWPDFWEFVRGDRGENGSADHPSPETIKVHWRRTAEAAT